MTVVDVPTPERLEELAGALGALDLSIDPAAEQMRERALRLASGYLAPRLSSPGGAKVVVVVGPSGSGKSTLVNSLARRVVSATSERRVTTLEPVVWMGDVLPPTLNGPRSRLPGSIAETVRRPPPGVVVVDAPPPDVLDVDGRPIAVTLIEAADGCILVLSAARYADAAGFELLEQAEALGVEVLVVLNRSPRDRDVASAMVDDLVGKLQARGLLGPTPGDEVVAIGETKDRPELLPWLEMAAVWERLQVWSEGGLPEERLRVSLAELERLLARLRIALLDAEVRRVELGALVDYEYRRAAGRFDAELRVGRFGGHGVGATVEALAVAITRHAGRAATAAADRWAAATAPPAHGLQVHSAETIDRAKAAVAAWAASAPRGRLGMPGARRRIRRLWVRLAVEPAGALSGREIRRARRRPGLGEAARRGLEDSVREVLAADAERFHALLGEPPGVGALNALRLDGPRPLPSSPLGTARP